MICVFNPYAVYTGWIDVEPFKNFFHLISGEMCPVQLGRVAELILIILGFIRIVYKNLSFRNGVNTVFMSEQALAVFKV